ncbi:MAG TPA: GxxExxY protein [Terriglobales bacterium]|nr:GxxExxY protein [Terriglobales bacterium]
MKHEALTEKLIGIFYSVYNDLGHGFLESIYQKAFTLHLARNGLKFEEQKSIRVVYMGVDLGDFRADLVVESLVIVELKAVAALEKAHERQLLNYLRATNVEVGLLLNFGPTAQIKRLLFDNERKPNQSQAAAAG